MKIIERKMLQIEEPKVNMEEQELKNKERNAIQKNELVPIEYYAINLMQLIKSKEQPMNETHREVTHMLKQLIETDATILEIESI